MSKRKAGWTVAFASAGLLVAAGVYALATGASDAGAKDVQHDFAAAYAAWKEHMQSPEMQGSSGPGIYMDSEEFGSIVELGPRAVPHIVKAMADESDSKAFHLWVALDRITHKRFVVDGYLAVPNSEMCRLWVQWFKGGQEEVNKAFEELYGTLADERKSGSDQAQTRKQIVALGEDARFPPRRAVQLAAALSAAAAYSLASAPNVPCGSLKLD
jgi:hypothetical protein